MDLSNSSRLSSNLNVSKYSSKCTPNEVFSLTYKVSSKEFQNSKFSICVTDIHDAIFLLMIASVIECKQHIWVYSKYPMSLNANNTFWVLVKLKNVGSSIWELSFRPRIATTALTWESKEVFKCSMLGENGCNGACLLVISKVLLNHVFSVLVGIVSSLRMQIAHFFRLLSRGKCCS